MADFESRPGAGEGLVNDPELGPTAEPVIEVELEDEARRSGHGTDAEHRVRAAAGDQIRRAAGRVHEIAARAEQRGGPAARAGYVAHSLGDTLDSTATYVHTTELEDMRRDLEEQVRQHPLRSVLIALGAGLLVGKIFR